MATQTINLTPSNTSSFYIQLVLTDSNVDSVNNKTTLSYSITFVCSTLYHFNYNNQLRFELNGTQLINTNNVASINLGAGGTQLLLSGSMDITHEADGSKNVPWYLRFNQPYGSSGVYTAQDSGTFVCERVPRTSSITVSNGTLGTAQTITITKATSSFTSILRYVCGGASANITATTTSSTSVSWIPPLALANQDTKGTSVLCTVYCDTYSGNTLIGTTSKAIALAVPASVKPSVSSTSVAEGNTSVLPAATFSGTYVQGKSRAVVTVTASTANCQGATISSCIVTIGGTAYSASVSNSGTTATCTVTSPTLSATGTVSISATVTDTRGRTATGTATSITVYEYSAPKINSFTVKRSDSEGTASDEGTYGTFSASGSYSSVNGKNTYTSTVKYGLNGSSQLTTLTYPGTTISDTVSGLDVDKTYRFIYTVTDRFTSVSKTVIVSTAFYTVDFLAGGHGIAFGKAAETADYFDCNMNAKFNQPVYIGSTASGTGQTLFMNGTIYFDRNSGDGIWYRNSGASQRLVGLIKGSTSASYCVALHDQSGSSAYDVWQYNGDQTFQINAPLIVRTNSTNYNVSNIISNFGQKINGNLVTKSITVRTWVTVANVVIPAGVSLVSYSVMINGTGNRLTACLIPDVGIETRSSVYSPDGNSYNCAGTFAITATQEKTMQLQVWSETLTSVMDVRLSAMQLFVQ